MKLSFLHVGASLENLDELESSASAHRVFLAYHHRRVLLGLLLLVAAPARV
jgi:hypothetical protein